MEEKYQCFQQSHISAIDSNIERERALKIHQSNVSTNTYHNSKHNNKYTLSLSHAHFDVHCHHNSYNGSHTCMNCHIYYDYNYIITISYIWF